MTEKTYEIKREGEDLIFVTARYKAEQSSVLHTGVYTNEFASMMLASAAAILAYFVTNALHWEVRFVRHILIVILFIAVFLGARKSVFREKYLKVIFHRLENIAEIIRPGIIFMSTQRIPFSEIVSVDIGSKKFVPENPDAVKFVEKISLQHGSAVPGFGQVEEYVTMSLRLRDESEQIIYAGKIDEEPSLPVREIREFIGTRDH